MIFVHGCFWHQHQGCRRSRRPATHVEFWNAKLDRNIERDRHNMQALSHLGWRALVVWECDMADEEALAAALRGFLAGD